MAILTINSGSSSLKLGLHSDSGDALLLSASVDGIGSQTSKVTLRNVSGEVVEEANANVAHATDALASTWDRMRQHIAGPVTAAGHRIVHGGPHLVEHCRITPEVQQQLAAAVHFAPLHIPAAMELLQSAEQLFPAVPHFACFDTAFHQTMPPAAFTYAIPRRYRDAGIRRFGFHGLSYESAVRALGPDLSQRTVIAHLGSGASVCAILQGKSVMTSMGLSPAGGFLMASRAGDLDPGVLLLLERGLDGISAVSADQVESIVNHDCGLKALADENDMRELVRRADSGDSDASLAISIFVQDVSVTIAGYASLLNGLNMLIFTGGIGEHSAPVREKIVQRLGFLGAALDPERNRSILGRAIESDVSSIAIRIVTADENGQIARHVASLLKQQTER